jgi:pyrroloquinoline quinone biosynthesis protein B
MVSAAVMSQCFMSMTHGCYPLPPLPVPLQLVAASDLALLDATLYSHDELPPSRDPSEIPHPLVTDSMARLAAVADKTVFVHLNHTNPLWDTSSKQHAAVVSGGFGIGQQGDVHAL